MFGVADHDEAGGKGRSTRRNVIHIASLILGAGITVQAADLPAARAAYEEDFDTAWQKVGSAYAYFDVKATRWNEIPALYRADLAKVQSKREFVELLEHVMDELYDPHAQLTVNTAQSPRIVPSGTDLWAEWRDGQAVITDVRRGSDAERAAIRRGSIVAAINGVAIADAVEKRLGRSYPHDVAAARDWALRAVLAGSHGSARRLDLRDANGERHVELPARDQFSQAAAPITVSTLQSGAAHLVFNDSLGNAATIPAFDEALLAARGAPALVIDLRNTPSGGNTTVARGILGRFVDREMPYQKHVLPSEERETHVRRSWLELVSPRGPFTPRQRVIVLVGHWTGSMGEGLAIAFDGTRSGTVLGTAMAGLLGATYHVTLPNTGIGLNVPAERLYHVDGTPREAFRPNVVVDLRDEAPGEDRVLETALRLLAN